MTPDPRTRISGLHKAALGALILDSEDWESRFADELEKHENTQGYSTLVSFAAGTAVRRKFSPTWSTPDVIRYVANLRMTLGKDASQIDPRLAEKLIRFLLGDNSYVATPIRDDDEAEVLSVAVILLMALVAEAGLDRSGVGELINEAAENARALNWTSLFPWESAGSPHSDGDRDEDAGGADQRRIGQGLSRNAGGAWESG